MIFLGNLFWFIAGGVLFTLAVVGYLYSTGSTINWAKK